MIEKEIFDWRWSDEKSSSENQLVIERNYVKGVYKLEGDQFIFKDSEGNERSLPFLFELRSAFDEKFSRLDITEIEDFLVYHFHLYSGEPKKFLKFARAVIMGSINHNDFALDHDEKKKIGLEWVSEMMQLLHVSPTRKNTLRGNQDKKKNQYKSLDEIFNKSKMTKSEFLKRLRLFGFIGDDNEWRKRKVDMIGLMRFLIEETNYITINEYAPLQRILATEIHFEYISKPTLGVLGEYIDQYKRVFPEAHK
jgi:signal peptidase I